MLPSTTESTPFASLLDATRIDPPKAGTERDAIVFATEHMEEFEALMFLRDFLKGNVEPYPEYIDFLAERQVKGAASVGSHQV